MIVQHIDLYLLLIDTLLIFQKKIYDTHHKKFILFSIDHFSVFKLIYYKYVYSLHTFYAIFKY